MSEPTSLGSIIKRVRGPPWPESGRPSERICDAGYQTVYIGCTALRRELHFGPKMLKTYYVFNDVVMITTDGQEMAEI